MARRATAKSDSAGGRAIASILSQHRLAEERDRRRIAVDLHDHISQRLATAKLLLSAIRASADARLQESLSQIVALLGKAIEASRCLTSELSPPALYELGLGAAVEWLGE